MRVSSAWWSDRTGGIIGGIMGATLGLLGALVGLLASLGKGRRLVMTALVIIIAVGVVWIGTALVALWRTQPYGVYYPLLLGGLLATLIPAGLLPIIRRRYEALELRRMNALDAH